jgi:hypothetical protein
VASLFPGGGAPSLSGPLPFSSCSSYFVNEARKCCFHFSAIPGSWYSPIRESGDIADTPGCTLESPTGSVKVDRGVISVN